MYRICVSHLLWCLLVLIAHLRKLDEGFTQVPPIPSALLASTQDELQVSQVSRNRRRKVPKTEIHVVELLCLALHRLTFCVLLAEHACNFGFTHIRSLVTW